MKNKNLKLKVLFPLFILTLATIIPIIASVQNTQSSTILITSKTNKETFYLREKVRIEGNITLDGTPVSDAYIILQINNPQDQPTTFRTIQIGNSFSSGSSIGGTGVAPDRHLSSNFVIMSLVTCFLISQFST